METLAMKLILLGEQATGKSSFLVALYGALVNRRVEGLRIARTIDEVEFLSRGLLAFGRQESLRRTEIDSDAQLLVEIAQDDRAVTLHIPDRSGELLRHMLDARVWDLDILEQTRVASAAMLFLRADQLEGGEGPEAFAGTAAGGAGYAAGAPAPGGGEPDTGADPVRRGWSPALMPADARAADLLQALLDQRSEQLPIAIIVSAWDRVRGHESPQEWLSERVTLLDQFLASNTDRLPSAVFGVSAQGGDFATGLPEPLAGEDPWDRAYLVGPDGERQDMAAPIAWLLEVTT
jgi:hypothetical protein